MEGLVDSARSLRFVRDQVDKVIGQVQVQIDVPMPQVGEEIVELPRIQEYIVDVPMPHMKGDRCRCALALHQDSSEPVGRYKPFLRSVYNNSLWSRWSTFPCGTLEIVEMVRAFTHERGSEQMVEQNVDVPVFLRVCLRLWT